MDSADDAGTGSNDMVVAEPEEAVAACGDDGMSESSPAIVPHP